MLVSKSAICSKLMASACMFNWVLQMMADTSCSWDAMFASVSTWPWGATALHQLMPNPWNNEVYLSLRIFIFAPYRYTYHIYVYIIIGKYVAYDVYLRWSKVDSTRIWLRHGCDAFAWCVSNSGCCLLWNNNSNGPVVIVFGCHKFMLESIDEVTSKCLSSSQHGSENGVPLPWACEGENILTTSGGFPPKRIQTVEFPPKIRDPTRLAT